ncbi:cytochrome c oxidase subunit NDUFA4 [Prorops nasuta]|uniref:cytochrome c oxidase subunit NDUFA4 n=1 Tax=Prorops nasuta TaxID=863751 RepID=UPI0034CD2F81
MSHKLMGLSVEGIKKNPSLIPLLACIIVGGLGASFYVFRLATKNPDVTWSLKKNPEPWNEYENKQYKFYSVETVPEYKSPAPKY